MSLSVIVYGRNDSHGYNLHKRAAISLNCIAEVLSGPDDEIVFVDYNTPDDLPTFPEAIQDTLTDAARARLRILRVRPSVHARYADLTHLVALEPIARNAALRRTNPANRWVLSTNTDMIFVPTRTGASLTEIAAGLQDGFYHLPRFELPECLWETFDRRDPRQVMSDTAQWAREFHLNEVVFGSETILYDAPGDFQLALREDLFAIDAFHEEMILGWHVDSNLAKRMKLHRGEVRSALDRLTGYHCDHTRQATLMHRRDRVENSSGRFVDRVERAGLPKQAETWGLAGEEIEELRLGGGASSRYLAGLRHALRDPQPAFTESHYTHEAYNRLDYDWRHALPFVLDSLSCCRPDEVIGYVGATPELMATLAVALEAMAPGATLLTLEGFNDASARPNCRAAAWPQWRDAADVYVFEVGRDAGAAAKEAALRSAEVVTLFDRFVAERAEGAATARVVAVNAVNTDFEAVLNRSVACTSTPYGARVRHGYLLPRPAVIAPDGEIAAGCRLADPRDWQDPQFGRWSARFMPEARTGWAWERAAFLTELDRAFGLGLAHPRPKVLLVAHLPEPLGLMLAASGVEVSVVDPLALLGDADAVDWRPKLGHLPSFLPDPLALPSDGEVYDAVVCPQNALLIRGPEGAGNLVRLLHARLRPAGLLLFSLNALLDAVGVPSGLNVADLRRGGFRRRFRKATGYDSIEAGRPDSGSVEDLAEGDPSAIPSLWCWRKAPDAAPTERGVAAAFLPAFGPEPVDIGAGMRAKDWVKRRGELWRLSREAPPGHAIFGPYISVQDGDYQACVEASATSSAADGAVLRLEVALGDEVAAVRDFTAEDLGEGRAVIDFTVVQEAADPLEVRIVHFGQADLEIGRILLSARP